MNSKKAKKLRGIARGATIGFPLVAYRTGDYRHERLRAGITEGGVKYYLEPQHMRRLGKCTRALYQQLKKAA